MGFWDVKWRDVTNVTDFHGGSRCEEKRCQRCRKRSWLSWRVWDVKRGCRFACGPIFISASLVTLFVLIFRVASEARNRVVSESDHVGNIVFVASAGRGKKICFACDPIISPRLWPYSASCLLRLWPYSMAHYVKSRRKASFTLRKAPFSVWIDMITQTLVADVGSNNMGLAYKAPKIRMLRHRLT